MTLVYREMTVLDLPAVFELRVATRENAVTMQELEEDYGITPRSLAEAMATHVRGWLCEDAGLAVGFAMGDRAKGEVQVVALRPSHERRGIGKRLLHKVTSWLFAEGHEEIWLLSNPDPSIRAYGFYRKLGWRATGERRGDDEVMTLRKTVASKGSCGPSEALQAPRG